MCGPGRIDASGRIAYRAVTAALGWSNGDRLTLTAEAGVVIARGDPGGLVTMPSRPCVVIPAAVRFRCGLPDAFTVAPLQRTANGLVDAVLQQQTRPR